MNKSIEDEVRYRLLKMMHQDPQMGQRQMADAMGVSLGKINYCIQELIGRGLVKIDRIKNSKNKLGYIYVLTPQGIEAKARGDHAVFARPSAASTKPSKKSSNSCTKRWSGKSWIGIWGPTSSTLEAVFLFKKLVKSKYYTEYPYVIDRAELCKDTLLSAWRLCLFPRVDYLVILMPDLVEQ